MAQETILADLSVNVPVFAVVALVVLILLLALCACREVKNNSNVSGIDYHSGPTTVTTQPAINKPFGNGTLPAVNHIIENGDGNAKIKVPTLQRKLPDIPVLPVPLLQDTLENASDSQSPDTGSELYATVDANGPQSTGQQQASRESAGTPSAEQGIEEQPATSLHNENVKETPVLVVSVAKHSQEPTTSSGDSETEHPYSHVQSHNYMRVKREHPYDWLKGQGSEERDTDTDNYDDPLNYTLSNNATGFRDWIPTDHSNFEPPPPPVPEKRFDLSSSGSGDDQLLPPSILTAANAVSGWVSASDIPYVTSPIDSPTHHQSPVNEIVPPPVVPEPVYNGSQDSTGSGPDIRYTSISVREPLANLRTQPRIQQPESYYSVVSDDEVDQTYAEIHSARASDAGSTLYAAVDPITNQHRELPPVPPPVESLRSLRTNHSRQGSTSSIISGSFVTTPTETSVNTSTPATSSTDIALNFINTDTKDLQSVDRYRFTDRRTIHVSEPKNYMQMSNVEDMYAKVLKNKRLSLHQDTYLNETSSNSSSFNSFSTKATPMISHSFPSNDTLPIEELVIRSRNFTNDNRPRSMITFTNYDKVEEANLLSSCSAQNVSNFVPFDGSSANFSETNLLPQQNEVFNFHHDPGYERIREKNANSDPDYETVFGNDVNDPNYETVLLSNNNDNADPGYEAVILSSINHEISDPGYETVNIHTVTQLDPDYETINLFQTDQPDPGYEQIRNTYEENEPGYERIVLKDENNEDCAYEQINLRTDTDLGNSQNLISCNAALEEQSPIKSFVSITSTDDDEEFFNDPGYEKVKFSPKHNNNLLLNEDHGLQNDNSTDTFLDDSIIWNGNETKEEPLAKYEEEKVNQLNKNSEDSMNHSITDLTSMELQTTLIANKRHVSTVEPDYATVNKRNTSEDSEIVIFDNFVTSCQNHDDKSLENKNKDIL